MYMIYISYDLGLCDTNLFTRLKMTLSKRVEISSAVLSIVTRGNDDDDVIDLYRFAKRRVEGVVCRLEISSVEASVRGRRFRRGRRKTSKIFRHLTSPVDRSAGHNLRDAGCVKDRPTSAKVCVVENRSFPDDSHS